MVSATVNISFPKDLLKLMDRVARQESRSRSELLRTAVRVYVERKQRWDDIFAFGRQQARRLGLKPGDVESLITEYRRSKAPRP